VAGIRRAGPRDPAIQRHENAQDRGFLAGGVNLAILFTNETYFSELGVNLLTV
jgi:hypothetical protein